MNVTPTTPNHDNSKRDVMDTISTVDAELRKAIWGHIGLIVCDYNSGGNFPSMEANRKEMDRIMALIKQQADAARVNTELNEHELTQMFMDAKYDRENPSVLATQVLQMHVNACIRMSLEWRIEQMRRIRTKLAKADYDRIMDELTVELAQLTQAPQAGKDSKR